MVHYRILVKDKSKSNFESIRIYKDLSDIIYKTTRTFFLEISICGLRRRLLTKTHWNLIQNARTIYRADYSKRGIGQSTEIQ